MIVPLQLVLDEDAIRRWYDEYVADVNWCSEHNDLLPDHPDVGYRTGTPDSYENYRSDVLASVLEEVIDAHMGYRLERAPESRPREGEAVTPHKEKESSGA